MPLKNYWKTNLNGFKNLIKEKRVMQSGNNINYVRYVDDFPALPYTNIWTDTAIAGFSGEDKLYVVQTAKKVIQRCMLMTTDPGDLVFDPTCGSGTTAFVAEQWGRRWITTDTSRIALNIAKTRLMTAVYPYYKLHDEKDKDIRQGFEYKKVPHITLKSLANDEPAEEETLFDQPFTDNKKLRVAGPFTVETLQNYDPVSPEDLDKYYDKDDRFIETIFEHLISAGVKNGIKNEQAVFTRVEQLSSPYLNAEGFYMTKKGESKAYFHIGPKFGTVSKQCVNEAVKECRNKGDADWLIILGFSFESDIENKSETTSLGTFEVTKVRMHDDLMQEGLLKKDKKAASFVTIGEPDVTLTLCHSERSEESNKSSMDASHTLSMTKKKQDIYKKTKSEKKEVIVEIKGLDIYDPIKDEVKSRDINDIAYWMLDDDYDGNNFMVRQVFFCGGEKDEYEKMKKNLEKLQKTLKIEIDEEAFERVYSHRSHPIEVKNKDQKIAVKVVSQFGEESMKVVEVNKK
ncbi:MAG: site-specific DNA-methyltransferase [Ignavibacteria bacterium]|nr:site-specific DNA-methyltransferase [Ignavibacteria bacterium]